MSTCTIDWPATAACAQAVLSAAAVFVAAWLQDRAIRKREAEALNRARESAAFAARWAWSMFLQIRDKATDGMDRSAFLALYNVSDWFSASMIARGVAPLSVQDEVLAGALLKLGLQISRVDGICNAMINEGGSAALNARSRLSGDDTLLFNAAASVERRAAQLLKRQPKL